MQTYGQPKHKKKAMHIVRFSHCTKAKLKKTQDSFAVRNFRSFSTEVYVEKSIDHAVGRWGKKLLLDNDYEPFTMAMLSLLD